MQKYTLRISLLIASVLLVLTSSLYGQLKSELSKTVLYPELKAVASPSLFDSQRFSMNHGFSLSFLSGPGLLQGTAGLSVYTNHMRYLIANNLLFDSEVYLVQPAILNAARSGSDNLQVYYQAGLDWQPLKNMKIHLGISNLPSVPYYYPGYRSMDLYFQDSQRQFQPDATER